MQKGLAELEFMPKFTIKYSRGTKVGHMLVLATERYTAG